MKILVIPGDGIGPEIVAAAVQVLQVADEAFKPGLSFDHDDAGFASLKKYGTTLRDELLDTARDLSLQLNLHRGRTADAVGSSLRADCPQSCHGGAAGKAASERKQQETVMTQAGQIVGDVEFRAGDGPTMPIPRGRVDIETSQTEVTLSWADEDNRAAATMPLSEFKQYVADGAIQLSD